LVADREQRRADDLTSALIDIHDGDPEAFTLDEIASILFSLSFAGHETTNYLIGNVARRLLEDRSRWERVVADPATIPAAVEETLRFDPSVCVWRRMTTKPASVGGVELPAGAKLFLWLAAAGRDASVFPEPDAFDLDRDNARRHPSAAGSITAWARTSASSRPSWRCRSSRGGSHGWRWWRDRS
jgi:cytochrome P450